MRNQFSQVTSRFNKFVSLVSFRIVQRRASFSTTDHLRLYTPVQKNQNKKDEESMSSRNHNHRKIQFNVSDQYEIIDIIGEGAYGVVAYVSQS